MPNRMLKESICTSEDLDKLSANAENLFYRLITKADDFGAYHGNASIIKGTCLPLKSDCVTSSQVEDWVNELACAGLIYLYLAEDGRRYVQFVKWEKHQNVRAKVRKYPAFSLDCYELPENCNCYRLKTDENNCDQLHTDVPDIQSNPIQEESNPKRKQKESNPTAKDAGRDYENDDQFESFWNAYPKKSGDIRQAYMEYLHAISQGVTPDRIIKSAHEQFDGIPPEDVQYMTSAERWLRNKGWEAPPRKEKKNGRKTSAGESVPGENHGSAPQSRWGASEYRYDN